MSKKKLSDTFKVFDSLPTKRHGIPKNRSDCH